MADESQSGDPYDVVLADLRAKRAQLDQAIAAIEAIKSGITAANPGSTPITPIPSDARVSAGQFHGLSIVEAVKQLLAIRKKPMSTSDITEGIIAGGVAFSTETPGNTVGSVLHREAARPTPTVISVSRGTWALPSWYPNPGRFQKKKPDEKGDEQNNGGAEIPKNTGWDTKVP